MLDKIHTESIPGNFHDAAVIINLNGWGPYLLTMTLVGGYTVCVFRMPADMLHSIHRGNPAFTHHPEFDNPRNSGYLRTTKTHFPLEDVSNFLSNLNERLDRIPASLGIFPSDMEKLDSIRIYIEEQARG